MPNRQGREVPVAPYDGPLPAHVVSPLGAIQRPNGLAGETQATVFEHLADKIGKFADEAATLEGDRAGKTAGLDPNFRPTGDATLRGRAYDDAATKTYQNNLDAMLRTDMQSIYEKNKNDPVALRKGFDTLGQEYHAQHVFPEIAGDFNASFARLRLPFQNKAVDNLDADVKDKARASLIDNTSASETNAARISQLNPSDPAASVAVASELKRIESLYDEAAANDVITAEAAAKLKTRARDGMVTRAALAQADRLATPEDVLALREATRKKFASGELKNLSADGFDSLDAKFEQIARAKRTQGNAAETLLKKNVDDYVQRSIDGLNVAPDEWTRITQSEGAKSPRGQQIVDYGQKQQQLGNILRNRSVEDGETMVAKLRQDINRKGNVTEGEADLLNFAEKYVKEQRNAINTDQLGLAAKKSLIPAISPLDFQGFAASTDPGAAGELAAQIRARTSQARGVAMDFQRAPQFLRPEEKARLKDIVDAGGDKALALAGAIVKGADADAPAVLREIGGDAPLLAQAGNIIVSGGSTSAARDAFQAAAMKNEKLKVGSPDALTFEAAVRKEYGDAFTASIDDGSRAHAAARAIASTRITRAGLDPKEGNAGTIYTRAAQEAAGALFVDGVQYGGVASYRPPANYILGNAKVLVPPGVRADSFRDVIGAVRDDDLQTLSVPPLSASGANYTAADIKAARPVAVRGGYSFAMGETGSDDPKWIRGANGRPFVLPFEQLAGVLRQRVPGAFIGGR